MQILRVRASLRRTAKPGQEPDRPRFGNLTYELQFEVLGAVFAQAIVAWLVSFFVHG